MLQILKTGRPLEGTSANSGTSELIPFGRLGYAQRRDVPILCRSTSQFFSCFAGIFPHSYVLRYEFIHKNQNSNSKLCILFFGHLYLIKRSHFQLWKINTTPTGNPYLLLVIADGSLVTHAISMTPIGQPLLYPICRISWPPHCSTNILASSTNITEEVFHHDTISIFCLQNCPIFQIPKETRPKWINNMDYRFSFVPQHPQRWSK